ncbi:hypothetical protein Tsubulata_037635 [Turnera subulata]|uniref:Zinc finger PHD-type domain-containing protein n=1 Tax=Turnera subulata TaxID=218843 RepID=A0A9Q0F3N8_9ROSI|nr:hypothetical protein Tsubulata_037635 [Turnera subulata]
MQPLGLPHVKPMQKLLVLELQWENIQWWKLKGPVSLKVLLAFPGNFVSTAALEASGEKLSLNLVDVSLKSDQEEGPCDICGSVGFAEKIATCHECKTSREHLYCFRKIVFAMPDMWVCEECEKFTHLANALVRYSSEKVHRQHLQGQDWGKFVVVDKETGIVKLRSCEEAGLLSSGDKSALDTGFRTPLSTLSELSKDRECVSATRQLTCQIKDEKSPLAHFDKPFLKEEPLGTSTPAETITVEKGKQKRAFDCKAELFATLSPAKRVDTFSTPTEKPRMHVLKEELTDNSTSVKRVKTSISEMTTTVALSASKDALPFIGSGKEFSFA